MASRTSRSSLATIGSPMPHLAPPPTAVHPWPPCLLPRRAMTLFSPPLQLMLNPKLVAPRPSAASLSASSYLLSQVDQPLQVLCDSENGKKFNLCEYNKDADSYRKV